MSPFKNIRNVMSIEIKNGYRILLSFDGLIWQMNPRETVMNPIIGMNGKIDKLSNEPKLKMRLGLFDNKL